MTQRRQNVEAVARGGGVMLVAMVLGQALLLGHDMQVNWALSTDAYGIYATCRRAMLIAFLFVFLGLENAVIRYVSESRADEDDAAVRGTWRAAQLASLLGGLAAAAVLWFGAGAVAEVMSPGEERLAGALRILSLALPLAAVRMMATSATQGLLVMWPKALILQVAWPAVNIVGVYVLAVSLDMGLTGVLTAYDISMAFGAVLAMWTLWRLRPDALDPRQPSKPMLQPLAVMALPLWIYTLVNALYMWADQLLLARIDGMEAAGIYGPVAALSPVFGLALHGLYGMFSPMIATLCKQGDRDELQGLFVTVTRWTILLVLPMTVGTLIAADSVVGVWPSGRLEAVPAMRIMAVAQLIAVVGGSAQYVLVMSGNQWQVVWGGVPTIVVNLVASYTLIPRYGATGAALAYGSAMCFTTVVSLAQVAWFVKIRPLGRSMVRPFVAMVPAAAAGWGTAAVLPELPSMVEVALVGLPLGLVYAVALKLVGLHDDDEVVISAVTRKIKAKLGR